PPRSKSAMYKIARYTVGGVNVVGVGAFTNHSALYFYRGRELDDGSGLLQGGGKDSRFVTLRSPADAGRPAIRSLVRKAFKLAKQPQTWPGAPGPGPRTFCTPILTGSGAEAGVP